MNKKMFIKTLKIMVWFAAWSNFGVWFGLAQAAPIINLRSDSVTLEARNHSLEEIINELEQRCQIRLNGLDSKLKLSVTMQYKGKSVEDMIKNLLRVIGETNYAFEYNQRNLVQVLVMPTSAHALTAPPPPPLPVFERGESEAPVRIVQVTDIIPNSQAETIGLQASDLIVEYDGVSINNTQQLIREVNHKAEKDQVEMVVIRDGAPMRMQLKGGQIGVRINTTNLPQEAAEIILQE